MIINTEFDRRDGLRTELSVALGSTTDSVTDYTYDNQGRMTSIEQSGEAAEKKITLDYDAAGRFASIKRYADLASELFVVDSQYEYDSQGRLTFLNHLRGDNMLAAYSYAYDSAGRINFITSFDGSTEYEYLEDGQLSSVDYDFANSSAIPGDDEDAISYDDNGNNITGDREAGEHNRPDTDGVYNYEYDDEGNRILRTSIADGSYDVYEWDHRNRLTGVTHYDDEENALASVQYAYDAFNRLVRRTYDADGPGGDSATVENFIYDGDQIILRLDGSQEVLNRYLWGPDVDQLLADEDATEEVVRWALGDHQNSVRDLVQFDPGDEEDPDDDAAFVVDHRTYSAFGVEAYDSSSSVETKFGFTGRFFDEAFQIGYHTHRWYDARSQQWLSVDPILFRAGDPNPRRYVNNDPVNQVDPSGLDPAGKFVLNRVRDLKQSQRKVWLAMARFAEEAAAAGFVSGSGSQASLELLAEELADGGEMPEKLKGMIARLTAAHDQYVKDYLKAAELVRYDMSRRWFPDGFTTDAGELLNKTPTRFEALPLSAGMGDKLAKAHSKIGDEAARLSENADIAFKTLWAADKGLTAVQMATGLGGIAKEAVRLAVTNGVKCATKFVAVQALKMGMSEAIGTGVMWAADQLGIDPELIGAGSALLNTVQMASALKAARAKINYCFPAGTLVHTELGPRSIEQLQENDQVWSFDLVAQRWVLRRVQSTFNALYMSRIVQITVQGEVIESTEHHPFWVTDGFELQNRPVAEHVSAGELQPIATGRWVDACHLQLGDVLELRTGRAAVVERLSHRAAVETVYNISVAQFHCYTVGVCGALVHNGCYDSTKPLSPSNYPIPDPPMSTPPVRYEPGTVGEVVRMRRGLGPTQKATHGTKNIEAHHRQQKSMENDGVMDDLEFETHRGVGNHQRHSEPSELTAAQRKKEISDYWKNRGTEYLLPGEGI